MITDEVSYELVVMAFFLPAETNRSVTQTKCRPAIVDEWYSATK